MDYSKVSDKKRVNATAMFGYTILMVILIAGYFVEVLKKSRTVPYFCVFLVLALVPYILCKILVSRDKETEQVKYVFAGGFFVLNLFLIFTTTSQVAYVYAIVVAAILLCYNHNKLNDPVKGLTAANEQVIKGIEIISAATEEVTAHSDETLAASEENSSIAGEVEETVKVLSKLAKDLTDLES